jgi:hypothetical protein
LGDRIRSASTHHAEECTKLVLERELLQEQLQEACDREAAALQQQKAATRREAEALRREIAAEERMLAAADRERAARELADQARKASAAVEAQETFVAALAAATARKEEMLAAREAEEVARLQELQKREETVEEELSARTRRLQEQEAAIQEMKAKVEEELAAGTQRFQEQEAAPPEREAKVEELLKERSASNDRITRWVGAVNPLLDALGANSIWLPEAPSPLGATLQLLDSTAKRLRDVEAGIQDLLEMEGHEVAWGMAECILTSFRSHDPTIQLTPVLVGPLRAMAGAAREGVLEAADMVAARLRRRPEPARSGSASGPPE